MAERDLDENEAWRRQRAAILRCQANPSEKNLAEVRRCTEALTRAMGGRVDTEKAA